MLRRVFEHFSYSSATLCVNVSMPMMAYAELNTCFKRNLVLRQAWHFHRKEQWLLMNAELKSAMEWWLQNHVPFLFSSPKQIPYPSVELLKRYKSVWHGDKEGSNDKRRNRRLEEKLSSSLASASKCLGARRENVEEKLDFLSTRATHPSYSDRQKNPLMHHTCMPTNTFTVIETVFHALV